MPAQVEFSGEVAAAVAELQDTYEALLAAQDAAEAALRENGWGPSAYAGKRSTTLHACVRMRGHQQGLHQLV